MRVSLRQSHGLIFINVESDRVCTLIDTSSYVDPYSELYIWLGQIRDQNLPATMIINEQARRVQLVAEKSTDDLIEFFIKPLIYGEDTTILLATTIERYELLKAFHDGIVEFIKNGYSPSDWSNIDDLSNTNWGALVNPDSIKHQNWQLRLAIHRGERGRHPDTNLEPLWHQLTLEQQWLVVLHDVLLKTATLAHNYQIAEIYALVSLYKNLPIDIALREIDPRWYEQRRTELDIKCDYRMKMRRTKRYRALGDARLATLKVGQLVDGRVYGVKPYGIFVDIAGYMALLHLSEISQLPVEHPKQIFEVEDWVRAIIISMDVERGRVSLSTRQLERKPGDMLTNPISVYETAEEMATQYCELVLSLESYEQNV